MKKVIGIEDVEYVAKLARLELREDEKKNMVAQLKNILQYVEKLNELDTKNVEPTAHILPIKNVSRPDRLDKSLEQKVVLKNAPKQKDGMFRVPRIIE